MALDFVSPDNVQECVRLTEEFRLLPKNHRAKEDKLEVPLFLSICVCYIVVVALVYFIEIVMDRGNWI